LVDLQAAIKRYLDEHNQRPKPFVWPAIPTASSKRSTQGSKRWRQTTNFAAFGDAVVRRAVVPTTYRQYSDHAGDQAAAPQVARLPETH